MRWALVVTLLSGCISTPRRPPIASPARMEMEALSRLHFMQRAASPAQRQRLAWLLDLHGRGAEAALLEAPDDPARAERAWFLGEPKAMFLSPDAARARLVVATARLPHDPRAIRTLWLAGRAAGLDVRWQQAIAARWRSDWPESTEALQAWRINQADRAPPAPIVDLDAWAVAHPIDAVAVRRAYAGWSRPATLEAPRWLAMRVLAVEDGARFRLRIERLPMAGPLQVERRVAATIPTADAAPIFRLIVRAWGADVEARDGAVSPRRSADGWYARFDGIEARTPDAWAPSAGPRWARRRGDAPATERATLRWQVWPRGEGWHGTLDIAGISAPRVSALTEWLPTLDVTAISARAGGRWRVWFALPGPPARSLLDDRLVEALGGPVSMARLATAPARRESLSLPPAAVVIELQRGGAHHTIGGGGTGGGGPGWWHSVGRTGDARLVRAWVRPAIDWTPARFVERRGLARAAHEEIRSAAVRGHALAPLAMPQEE